MPPGKSGSIEDSNSERTLTQAQKISGCHHRATLVTIVILPMLSFHLYIACEVVTHSYLVSSASLAIGRDQEVFQPTDYSRVLPFFCKRPRALVRVQPVLR